MSRNQDALMIYDPAMGDEHPYPSHAEQWRSYHGRKAWLFNPWTGERRSAEDVGSDAFGLLVLPPGAIMTQRSVQAQEPRP